MTEQQRYSISNATNRFSLNVRKPPKVPHVLLMLLDLWLLLVLRLRVDVVSSSFLICFCFCHLLCLVSLLVHQLPSFSVLSHTPIEAIGKVVPSV
jgi:hypothetical protein